MAAPAWAWAGLCSPPTRAISPLCHPRPAQPQSLPPAPQTWGTRGVPAPAPKHHGLNGIRRRIQHIPWPTAEQGPGPACPTPWSHNPWAKPRASSCFVLQGKPCKNSTNGKASRGCPKPDPSPSRRHRGPQQRFQAFFWDLLLFISSHISALNISALSCLSWGFSRAHREALWALAAPSTLPAAPRTGEILQDAP